MFKKYEIPIEELRVKSNLDIFPYETTKDIKVDREFIGQDRAMESLKYGLSMKTKGYNIYVSGLSGTGKNSYSYIVAKEFAENKKTPKDWCYVYNFNKANSPRAISMEAGQGKDFKNEIEEAIKKIEEETVFLTAISFLDTIQMKYRENKGIIQFLKDMKKDIIANYEMFLDKNEDENYIEKIFSNKNSKRNFLKRYSINLFIDNSNIQGGPIIKEMNPNYYNLFGKIEYANELGVVKTDHIRIKPGSLHEANGGYIIIQARDILQNSMSWDALKRTLITGVLKIENIMGANIASETLSPEVIPLDIKVIIIGDNYIYNMLYSYDDEFKKLFKIRADFDTEMDRNKENILKIASFVAYQCQEEDLLAFDKGALGRIIDLSSRIAEDKTKLTARFNELVEIIYEAHGWASSKGKKLVNKEDIEKAIRKKQYRNNIYEEKTFELIKDGTLIIDTHGEKIGEINGLSVIDLGQYAFGRPTKITANTYFGKDGIINIEKEVEQSGNIHDKGILILSGYLGERYAQDIQLSLTASITFEQSYDGIDGDSASSTELYALLSSLGELPIKQGIAATGSVNQKGKIQPIGGVNEKIEGYYNICKVKGFIGGEGVIIPNKNIDNLILNEEIVDAVKEGIFTIYGVDTIDEGMEILTGVKAGELNEDGIYEENTVNGKVQGKLNYYAMINEELEE